MIRRAIALLLCLSACGEVSTRAVTALPEDLPRFAPNIQARGVARSNQDIAQDFLDLTFALEGGDILPRLLKYDGPIRVALRSPGLSTYQPELDHLLNRLRREAGLDISQTFDTSAANIHIQAIPRETIRRAFPGAACFIVPGVTSWSEFRRPTGGPAQILWSAQEKLTRVAIFIPADSTPQDTRDCLHEEMAQALGPANDLYRIADTVFNDDNFHSILTPFDMLVLRTLYDDSLRVGMSRPEVAERLLGILNRINPAGRVAPTPRAPETRVWKTAIEGALDRRRGRTSRLNAANRAISLANAMSPPDHRLGLALLTRGRIEARTSPRTAASAFDAAYRQFTRQFGSDDIRAAHVALHLALFALRDGRLEDAVSLARTHIPAARRAENAVVLSGLLAIEAEAFLAAGDLAAARRTRVESLTWARYAFGDEDGDIARAQAQIAAFNPKNGAPS